LQTFKLLKCMQNLHQSMWDHEMWFFDWPLKDEKLLIGQVV
jgi:hypothetical protein